MAKNIILFLFSVLIPNLSHAQVLKKKINANGGMKEIYYQKKIKGVGKVKEGDYKKYYKSTRNCDILIKKGQYKNDKKYGIWTYYNTEGDSIYAFNYDRDTVEFINKNAKRIVRRYQQFYLKQRINMYTDKPNMYATSFVYSVVSDHARSENISQPIFVTGDSEFYNILFASIIKAIQYNAYVSYNFTSIIKLKINKEGILEDINIDFSSSPKMNDVKRNILAQGLKWIPAYENGKPVDYELSVPIFCHSREDEGRYYFDLTFCRRELYDTLTPSCDEWPYKLGGDAKVFVWVR
ncbi:energy transducer TonB [Labilibaculum sp. DW002]|uniref:Energy transducer TonB n=1 Tax=Paralabilibaculum antarcticum TaxID=2912572 RepID=A0ABT5VPF3_9BACT|nr:hypothetical protein [Labilibaculum sp. DW002]MDE5417321.1 energy transducer TonB [Labilibaculum sp. DW002]